jgi:hypothetical protein
MDNRGSTRVLAVSALIIRPERVNRAVYGPNRLVSQHYLRQVNSKLRKIAIYIAIKTSDQISGEQLSRVGYAAAEEGGIYLASSANIHDGGVRVDCVAVPGNVLIKPSLGRYVRRAG